MERTLVWLDSKHVGEGKTSVVQRVLKILLSRQPDLRVGGFSFTRIYGDSNNNVNHHIGYEAHLWGSGVKIEIARNDRPEWIPVDTFSLRQFDKGSIAGLRVNEAGLSRLYDLMKAEIDSGDFDAYVVDEIGGCLGAANSEISFYELARKAVLSEVPIFLLVFQDLDARTKESMLLREHLKNGTMGHGRNIEKILVDRDNHIGLQEPIASKIIPP